MKEAMIPVWYVVHDLTRARKKIPTFPSQLHPNRLLPHSPPSPPSSALAMTWSASSVDNSFLAMSRPHLICSVHLLAVRMGTDLTEILVEAAPCPRPQRRSLPAAGVWRRKRTQPRCRREQRSSMAGHTSPA
jgi:hypothetical protein